MSSGQWCDPRYQNYPQPAVPPYVAVYAGRMYDDGSGGVAGVWPLGKMTITSTRYPSSETSTVKDVSRTCNGALYPQPCHHYRSVGIRNPFDLRRPLCPNIQIRLGQGRDRYPKEWNLQHLTSWYDRWLTRSYIAPYDRVLKAVDCQRDEWPPYA